MNLFAGQHERGEQTCGHRVERRGWDKWIEQYGNVCATTYKICAVGIGCMTQGSQTGAL